MKAWKKLISPKSPPETYKHLLSKEWESFQDAVNSLSSTFSATVSSTFSKRLGRILKILTAEDKLITQTQLSPCIEYCLTNGVFFQLAQLAQSSQFGFLKMTLSFLTCLISSLIHQNLFLHMEFHSSIKHLLLSVYLRLMEGQSFSREKDKLLELLFETIKLGKENTLYLDTVYNEGEYLPGGILYVLIQNEVEVLSLPLKEVFFELISIKDDRIYEELVVKRDLMFMMVTKLSFYYQALPLYCELPRTTEKLSVFAEFFDEFYLICPWNKERLRSYFYYDFLVMTLTARLHSTNPKIQYSSILYLVSLVKSIKSTALLTLVTYFILGKDKEGNKNSFPLIPAPGGSTLSKRLIEIESFSKENISRSCGVSRNWDFLIDILNSKNEELSTVTFQLFYSIIEKANWRILELLITDSFAGVPPSNIMSITADAFFAMFPTSVIGFQSKTQLSKHLGAAVQRTINSLHCALELRPGGLLDPGATFNSLSVKKDGGTGGTPKVRPGKPSGSWKFFEGDFLEAVHRGLRRFFSNSLEKNLFITGILSELAAFPEWNVHSALLHNLVYEPHDDPCGSFVGTLKSLAFHVDSCLVKENVREALTQVKSQIGMNEKGVSFRFHSKNLPVCDRRVLESYVVLQEFLKELGTILVFKELSNEMVSNQ